MTTTGMFLGQFYLTSAVATAPALTVGGTGVDLTAGYYYTAGGGDTQLCEHIQAQIRAIGASQDATTVVLNSTPRVVITLETAGTLSLDATLATILGFTSTSYSSATTFTAEQQPRYVWAPTRAPSYHPVNDPPLWVPRSGTVSGRTPDGTTFSVVRPTVYDASLEFRDLPKEDVITPTTGTVYRDFQQWFVDVPAAGMPFRWVYDRSDYTAASDYFTAVWMEDGADEVGSMMDAVNRRYRSYLGLFSVKIPMAKKV